jgi:phospholipid/cholesterol/gamma-HCH transport system substrate-binding protein
VRRRLPRLPVWFAPVLAFVATIGVVALGKRLLFDHPGGYVVYAEFRDASGIRPHSYVKVGAVPAGLVVNMSVTPRDTAMVKMRLDSGAAPIGTGATATIRPANLLGEMYIDLNPGNLARPVPSGTLIPISRTGRPVQLDQILDTLDPTTSGALRVLINEAGVGMAGRGADFSSLLSQLPPAFDQLRQFVASVGANTQQLKQLVDQGDQVLGSMASGRHDLNRFVDAAERTLQTAASRRAQLGQTLAAAPGALWQLRDTLVRLQSTARQLGPLGVGLQRSAPELTPVLQQFPSFAAQTTRAMELARQAAPPLAAMASQGTPTVARLATTGASLQTFGQHGAPVFASADASFNDLLGFMEGWARTIQERDGIGHVFRTRETIGSDALQHLIDTYVLEQTGTAQKTSRQAAPARRQPASAPAPVSTRPTPTKTSGPSDVAGQVISGVSSLVNHTVPGEVGQAVQSVLGVAGIQTPQPPAGQPAQQGSQGGGVQQLFNYLLGP